MGQIDFYQITEKELNALQQCELDILKSTIFAIESLGLRYYAVGGTALGAVKYSGFIPWDDDVDIAMPRKDFLIFIKEAYKYLPKRLVVQSLYNDSNYTLGVAKIRNEETTYFDIYTAQYNVSHGVFIDIFPIDDCGNKNPIDSFFYKARENKIAWSNFFKPDGASLKNRFVSLFCKTILLFENPHKCALRNDRFLTSLGEKEETDKVFMRIEKHNKSFFTGNKKVKFCDIDLVVPNNVEEYLKNCYGDFKQDPPLEKRFPHHFALKIDLNNSYKNYLFKKGRILQKK